MTAPGVEIRPLVQITGEAEFNEVFLDEVFVPADQLVGPVGQGWKVASTTLAHERGTNFPFKEEVVHEGYLARLFAEAADNGSIDDPAVADALVDAYVSLVVLRAHNWRTLSKLARGEEPGPESSWVKLDVVGHDPAPVGHGPRRTGPVGPVARVLAAPVAVVEGGEHRRGDVRGPAQHHRRADPRPPP